jgi:HlyD family secretion protein
MALALAACSEGEAREADGPSITTSEAIRDDLMISVEATGQVEPIRNVEVKSRAGGEIMRLYADVGDRVEAGQLLAEVDPRDVRNAFNQAEADLAVAEARDEIARSQLQRSKDLLESEVITPQEYESSNLEYANAQAQLVKAQTNLELAELRLQDVTIRAPMAGTILARNVEEGTVIQSASGNVSGGTTLFLMANLDAMQVRTLVDETDMGQIEAGKPANVNVEAYPGRPFRGEVEKIEPQAVVQQNVTMFPVIVQLDNRDGLLRPGMNAEVEVSVAQRPQTILVPNNAIVKPQEMAPAAMVLGMDPEGIEFDQAQYRALTAELRGEAAPAEEAEGGSDEAPQMSMEEIRAKVQSGEISREEARAMFQAAGGGRGGAGGWGGRPGGAEASEPGAPTPAVAFVQLADGTFEARAILTGVNDWDNTEVLIGIEEGEAVALIGAAALQAQQQEWINRIRERMGGGVPGMSGGRR